MNIFTPLSTTTDGPLSRDGGRLPTSVVKILEGALRGIASRGVKRLSMSDISDASGVSRGTLYRYFSTKEEVMAAVAEFVCTNFETGVLEAAERHDDPIQRFRAVMRFFSRFTVERSPERMLEVEPSFYLEFFNSHFARHKAAVEAALERTFDYFDEQWGRPIDRPATAEALVRMQLSSLIVPTDARWAELWESAPDRMQYWISEFAGKIAPCKEK
jgi:AcrR family transcriptional regulator